ncbi:AMP-binding protein [Clostridium swellfunianum]|uniref:AMP-binding protein n=1 Tax=Clostridium swellfunianum TaxID=1367462 RepID=UPI00202E8D59|nr:AMP-binding protein [Clostridium swellfunianum]MCM0648128.1 AMP-binding protein [Clostridium swellfunianum]
MGKRFYETEKLRDIRVLLKRGARLYSDRIAYKEVGPKKQIYEYKYSQLESDVDALGTKLLQMGMKGYHIAVLGENSYAWVVSYLTVVNGVGVVIPMDKELTDEDICKLIVQSDTDAIICSDTFAQSVKNILSACPNVKHCIVMNPKKEYPEFFNMKDLTNEGKELIEKGSREYLDADIDVEAVCEIVFTSGTTGANKGVMLSHKSIMAVVHGALSLIDARGISFSVLPINHTYECSCHILGGIYSGITVCFNDSLKRVVDNMKLFKPNMTLMVPLFVESMYKKIWKEAEKNNLDKHLRYGIKVSNLIRKIGIDARRLFFKPVLKSFGGNLNQIVCGGAPLREEIIKGLSDFGIEILNGYGITECGPLVSTNSFIKKKPGSVGRIIPDCQVRIYDPQKRGYGEIQVKGDNVMLGYYKDEENTKLSFTEDGWLKTGDLGYIDKHNFLYINGREKNLIILSNGKNVHPEEIEDIITEKLNYVKEVVVYAPSSVDDFSECINAAVYIDEEFLTSNGIASARDKLNNDIRLLNRNLPAYKRIADVFISESEFEKTTTKKIKRALILERSLEHA